ncbi:class I SAM-dependent methyltransferase [Candidatus Bipolaricaulota bacterium]
MDSKQTREYWDGNADAWTKLSRAGYDTYRDHLNTPSFFEMLPNVDDLEGIDIGCGEGYNTRLLAQRGARIVGIDVSERFVEHARTMEKQNPLDIEYAVADACDLQFEDDRFDFATAFMSMMDIPTPDQAIAEAFRVLMPGGFFQFSISHPCFDTPHRVNKRHKGGMTYAMEVGDYFAKPDGRVMEWLFSAAPTEAKQGLSPFKVPRFTMTLSSWLNMLLDAGFVIERVAEPMPSDEIVQRFPNLQDAQVVAYFLHVRVCKPLG